MTPRQTALSQLGIPPDSELQDVTLPDFTVGIGFATSPASEVDLDRIDPGWEFAPDDPTGQLVLARRMPGTYALETDLPPILEGMKAADIQVKMREALALITSPLSGPGSHCRFDCQSTSMPRTVVGLSRLRGSRRR